MPIKYTSPIDMGNQRIMNVATPAAGTDVANKNYVDAAINGLYWHPAARCCPTGAVDLTTPGTVYDGVQLEAGDRVLLQNQPNAAENGIYVWTGATAALARAADMNDSAQLANGAAVTVVEGATYGDKAFLLTTDGDVTLGTTPLSWSPMSSGGGGLSYSAGNGLVLQSTQFRVQPYLGVLVGPNGVQIDPVVVARKFAQAVGDGVASVFDVTHNLGSLDVLVDLVEVATGASAYVDAVRLDVNTVRLTFGAPPATGEYRVVIHG